MDFSGCHLGGTTGLVFFVNPETDMQDYSYLIFIFLGLAALAAAAFDAAAETFFARRVEDQIPGHPKRRDKDAGK